MAALSHFTLLHFLSLLRERFLSPEGRFYNHNNHNDHFNREQMTLTRCLKQSPRKNLIDHKTSFMNNRWCIHVMFCTLSHILDSTHILIPLYGQSRKYSSPHLLSMDKHLRCLISLFSRLPSLLSTFLNPPNPPNSPQHIPFTMQLYLTRCHTASLLEHRFL